MRDSLLSNSKRFNQRALGNYLNHEIEYFLINAAISAELLGKAFLAGFHPSLISDEFDSLLHLCGAGQYSKKSPEMIRTIGAREVFRRCIQILPKLKDFEKELNLLADIRNGLVHLGECDEAFSTVVLDPYLKYARTILDELDAPMGDFFGDSCPFVTTRIQDSVNEIEARVYEKIAKAKVDLEKRFAGMDEATKKVIIETITGDIDYKMNYEEPVECPVCNSIGKLSGEPEVVEWKAEYDENGIPENAYPVVELLGDSFKCRVCGLELPTFEELEVSGLDTKVSMDNIDPADFYGNPYDDYDY